MFVIKGKGNKQREPLVTIFDKGSGNKINSLFSVLNVIIITFSLKICIYTIYTFCSEDCASAGQYIDISITMYEARYHLTVILYRNIVISVSWF